MSHVLFESPLKLVVIELGVGLVLLWWVRRWARPAGRLLVGYLVLAVGLLVVQALVVTDAEKVRRVTRELARAVDFGEIELIRAYLADDFASWGYDRDGFVEFVYGRLEVYQVDEVWVGGAELRIEGVRAQIEFTARGRVGTNETGLQPYLGRWRLRLRREAGKWVVTRVEYLAGPGVPSGAGPGS